MKTNPVKAALASGEPQIGTWLSLPSVFSARLMSRVGFPWLTVDLEHSPTNWETASLMFAAIADSGCVPLARVPRGDHDLIKRVLDGGAMGIVVPMVDTVEQARTAIAAARYPPTGNRSIGGTIPALNFAATAREYYDGANDQTLVVLQTESPEGIANADEIYALPGVDAIFVGPNDLFWQMKAADGTPPTPDEFEAALQAVLSAGKKAGTPVGVHAASVEEVQRRVGEGWQFMAIKSELRMMLEQADRDVRAWDSTLPMTWLDTDLDFDLVKSEHLGIQVPFGTQPASSLGGAGQARVRENLAGACDSSLDAHEQDVGLGKENGTCILLTLPTTGNTE